MILAVDLGGTSLRLGLSSTGAASPWLAEHRCSRPEPLTTEALTAALGETLATWKIRSTDLAGCGVSVAAVVDGGRVVRRAENLGWHDVPLAGTLEATLGCPVQIDTDVFCGALYEARHGLARNTSAVLYVAIGTGVGHALILDGRVWRGSTGAANAIGHAPVIPDGRSCYCGHTGCLCTVASGRAGDLGYAHLDPLARALAFAVTLIEPDRIVLSGGALAQPWFDLARLRVRLADLAYPTARLAEIAVSAAPDPNLRGAACLFEEKA